MRWLTRVVGGLNALFRWRRVEQDLDEELRAYLESSIAEKVREGRAREDASRAARVEIGSVEAVKDRTRDVGWEVRVERLWQDIRYSVRSLRRTPAFTAAVVITLALGIGANAAIFSLLDGVMFKPLDVPNADELSLLQRGSAPDLQFGAGSGARFSYPAFQRLSEALPSGTSLVAMSRIALMTLRSSESSQAIHARTQLVSGSYFSTLRSPVSQGRLIDDSDNLQQDSHPVAVLSYAFWQQHLGGSASVIGSPILLNSVPFTVIGVVDRSFTGVWVDGPTDMWIPVVMQHAVQYRQNFSAARGRTMDPWLARDDITWLTLVARAPVAVTPALRAALEAAHLRPLVDMADAAAADSDRREAFLAANRLRLTPFTRGLSTLRTQFGTPLYLLMAIVVVVLLVACANVANLLLARGVARSREMGIRLSVGASRIRLVQQLLVESVLLSAVGCAAGVALGMWTSRALATLALLPPFALDARILGFSLGVAGLTALVFGLTPALRATQIRLVAAVGSGSTRGSVASPLRQMRPLLAMQVALAVVLTVGAAVFARTLAELTAIDPGFERHALVSVWFRPSASGYTRDALPGLHQRLLSRVTSLPGVESAALSFCALADGCRNSSDIEFEGYQPAEGEVVQFQQSSVGLGYFETVGMPIVEGRGFDERDNSGPLVVVVNETIARKYFRGRSPVGRRMRNESVEARIIGVVRDARTTDVTEAPVPMAFSPLRDSEARVLQARVTVDPDTVLRDIQRALGQTEPGLAIERARTIDAQLGRNLTRHRLVTYLAAGFGVLALFLASVGLYGVMAYGVARRTPEIGVRVALGAHPAAVVAMVLRDGMRVAIVGIILGIVASVGAARAVTPLLFGISAADVSTYAIVAVVVFASAGFACYLPARRAARVDPAVALRAE
jgi:predicted permease